MNDLEKVDPRGNLAVLIYKGLELLAKGAESKYGISGIWDATGPHINKLVAKHLGDYELSVPEQIMIEILRANYKKATEEKL